MKSRLFFEIRPSSTLRRHFSAASIARFNLRVTNPSQTNNFAARISGRNLKLAKKMQGRGIFYPHYRIRCSLRLSHVIQSACLKMRRRNGTPSAIRFLFGTASLSQRMSHERWLIFSARRRSVVVTGTAQQQCIAKRSQIKHPAQFSPGQGTRPIVKKLRSFPKLVPQSKKEETNPPNVFVFCEKSTGAARFHAESNSDPDYIVERMAGLLAVQ